jgi:hypothetical protein
MICRSANAPEYPVSDVASTVTAEESIAIYLQDTPMGNALGWIGVVLVVLTVIASALLACPVYALIWLSRKARPLGRRLQRVETSGQKDMRHDRLKTLHGTVTNTGQVLKSKLRYRL